MFLNCDRRKLTCFLNFVRKGFLGAGGLLEKDTFAFPQWQGILTQMIQLTISMHTCQNLNLVPSPSYMSFSPDHTCKLGYSQNFMSPHGNRQGAKEGLKIIHLGNMRGEKVRKQNQTSSWVQSTREPLPHSSLYGKRRFAMPHLVKGDAPMTLSP